MANVTIPTTGGEAYLLTNPFEGNVLTFIDATADGPQRYADGQHGRE